MFCVCNLQKRGGVYNIHKLLDIGENTWWKNFTLSLFDQGCIWRLRKARLHHIFKLKITPGFTLSDVSHMHHMHECMVLVPVSKINMTESFQIFSHLPLKLFCQIIPPVHLQYWPCLWIGEGFYKNPFVCDRGLTQPRLGSFLNSKLFLE